MNFSIERRDLKIYAIMLLCAFLKKRFLRKKTPPKLFQSAIPTSTCIVLQKFLNFVSFSEKISVTNVPMQEIIIKEKNSVKKHCVT